MPRAAQDDSASREVRAGHDLNQLVDADLRGVDDREAGIDDLAQIVRRHVGRHADRDAAGAVDQKVRDLGRQHLRLARGLVVIGLEVDGLAADVIEHLMRGPAQADLGVAHRRRRIAVHRAEIALAVDQQQAHREVLRHAHHGIVDRGIAVGVVFAHHVAGQRAPTCDGAGSTRCLPRASRTECGGAPASARRAHRAARARRSRSSRNRDRSAPSPLRG